MKIMSQRRTGQRKSPEVPLANQRRIVSEFEALKRLQSETAAELDARFPAILDRAFKGEL